MTFGWHLDDILFCFVFGMAWHGMAQGHDTTLRHHEHVIPIHDQSLSEEDDI